MSVGRQFIASDVDGLHEVVKDAGILFPDGDSEALANVILRLENDPKEYKIVAELCYSRAKDFDISGMTDGYLKIYNSL